MKLLDKLSKILKGPHPLAFHIFRNTAGAVTLGVFVFFFLLIFRPFGLQALPGKELVALTGGYGLVTAGYLIVHLFVMMIFLHEKNWTVWKEIINTLIIISMIGLCNYIYHSVYFSRSFVLIRLAEFQMETLVVSFFPVSLLILLRQNILLKKHIREAENINRKAGRRSFHEGDDRPVVISAQNPKNDFTCNYRDIVYIQGLDNYVVIHLLTGSGYLKEIIRTTLKKAKDDLQEYPGFFQCHKSYIVNLEKVIKVSGNAQGLKLHFEHLTDSIPVSRQLHLEFTRMYGIKYRSF